jgi:glucosylceramidase
MSHAVRVAIAAAVTAGLAACGGGSSPGPATGFTASGPTVQVTVTSGDQSLLLAAQPAVSFGTGGDRAAQTISVNDTLRYQPLEGIGASLTDSAAWVIANDLDAGQRDALMQELFDAGSGIGLGLLRQPMGASDFAVNGNYSYDDVAAGQSDPQLLQFSIAHDQAYIVPLLQQALAINPALKVLAVPWSPPAWMKSSATMNGGSIDPAYLPSLAQYFVRFLQAYQNDGIAVYAIAAQNEPLYATSSYPSASMDEGTEASFIGSDLGPALAAAGFGPGLDEVKILGYDHNWDNTAYPESLLAGAAAPFIAGTAFHCYGGDVSAQSLVHDAYPDKEIWFTECSGTVGSDFAGDLVWNTENLLIGATRNWARSVSLWNLALDQDSGPTNGGCMGCRGVVTIDTRTAPATIIRNVEYYALGQLAKFALPGAVRIDTNSFTGGGVEDVAFQNPDGSIVLLALNPAGMPQSFAVTWQGKYFNYTLPAQSVATLVWH